MHMHVFSSYFPLYFNRFATLETTDGHGHVYSIDPGRQCAFECLKHAIISNLPNTIVFAPSEKPYNKQSYVRMTAGLHLQMTVLFIFLKLVFVALPSGTVWGTVDVPERL